MRVGTREERKTLEKKGGGIRRRMERGFAVAEIPAVKRRGHGVKESLD